jgi:hypothetical protein
VSGESFCHEWEDLGDRRTRCGLVVGGVKESFDGFGPEGTGEPLVEPGGGGAEGECGVDAEGAPGGCSHDAVSGGA